MDGVPGVDQYQLNQGRNFGGVTLDSTSDPNFQYPPEFSVFGLPPNPNLKFKGHQYPKFWEGKAELLAEIITQSTIANNLSFILSATAGIPIHRTEQQRFTWNEMFFDVPWLEKVPEEGVSKTFRSSFDTHHATVSRRGVSGYIEDGFLNTPMGAQYLMLMLQRMETGTLYTYEMITLNEMLRSRSSHYKNLAEINHKPSDYREMCKKWAMDFDAGQKNEHQLGRIITVMKEILGRKRGFQPNGMYVQTRGYAYLGYMGAKRLEYYLAGPSGPDRANQNPWEIDRYMGLPVYYLEDFNDGNHVLYPLDRIRQFGHYYTLHAPKAETLVVENFKAHKQSIQIIDLDAEQYRVISLQDCLENCHAFNEDGELHMYNFGVDPAEPGAHLTFGQLPQEVLPNKYRQVIAQKISSLTPAPGPGGAVAFALNIPPGLPAQDGRPPGLAGKSVAAMSKETQAAVVGSLKGSDLAHLSPDEMYHVAVYKRVEKPTLVPVEVEVDKVVQPAASAASATGSLSGKSVSEMHSFNEGVVNSSSFVAKHGAEGPPIYSKIAQSSKLDTAAMNNFVGSVYDRLAHGKETGHESVAAELASYAVASISASDINKKYGAEYVRPAPVAEKVVAEPVVQKEKMTKYVNVPKVEHVMQSTSTLSGRALAAQGANGKFVYVPYSPELGQIDVSGETAKVNKSVPASSEHPGTLGARGGTLAALHAAAAAAGIGVGGHISVNAALNWFNAQPITKTLLEHFIDDDIPFPFGFLVAQPFVQTLMASILLGHFGPDLGFFAQGRSKMMFGPDVAKHTHSLHYVTYGAPVIIRPQCLVPIDDVWCKRYRGGMNAVWFTPDDWRAVQQAQFRILAQPRGPSLICYLTSAYVNETTDTVIDVRGRFSSDSRQDPPHFFTFAEQEKFFAWPGSVLSPDFMSDANNDTNTVLFQGHQREWNERDQDYTTVIIGKSPLGPNQYPHMRSVLDGDNGQYNIFEDMGYNKNPASRFI